jgi:predicted DNA-binding protein
MPQARDATSLAHGIFLITCNAIERQLDDLEDIYLAERRLEDARTGRSKTFTLDEVERDLGLAG